MQNKPTENQLRINEIARLIDELSTELSNRLKIEDNYEGTDIQEIRREIRVSDLVEITNNYHDQLGKQGTVTRITDNRYRLDWNQQEES